MRQLQNGLAIFFGMMMPFLLAYPALGQADLQYFLNRAQLFKTGNADSILKNTEKLIHNPNASSAQLAECYYLNAIGYDKKGNYALADRSILQSAAQFIAIGDQKGKCKAKIFSAWIAYNKGEVLQAIDSVEFYLHEIDSEKEIEDMDADWLKIMGNGYSDLGLYYSFFKDKVRALKSFELSEKYRSKLGDQNELAELWNNMGLMLLELESYKEAEFEFQRSLKTVQAIQNKSAEASCFHNLGKCYKEQGLLDSALVMYQRCLSIRKTLKERKGVSSALRKIALVHKAKGNYPLSFSFAKSAWQLSAEIKDRKGLIDAEFMLAELFQIQGLVDSAFWYGQRAYINSKDLDAVADIRRTSSFMKELYKSRGMLAEALIASEDMQSAEQRMNDDEVRRLFLKKQYDEKQAEAQQIIIVISIITVLLVGLVFFVFRAYKIKRKTNELITFQKNELEEKNGRIVESIIYSQRLQNALLPSIESIQTAFKKIKVTYQAKDIVAGDFYWCKHKGDWTYLAVGDCTGHGVPGALVSMMGINALNQAIVNQAIVLPAEILIDCRNEIIRAFGASDGQVIRDGMDISLLAINIPNQVAFWAGANRPCWYWNENNWQLLEGDKQSISCTDSLKDFTNVRIDNLKSGHRFVMYTDGLTDQFGGDRNKKIGRKKIKSFFYDSVYDDLEKQHDDLEELWVHWKGDEEQTDDLCLVSIEI